MRWLVFFLLILNGLVFVWFNFQQQYNNKGEVSAEAITPFEFATVPTLRLLDELPSAALQQRDTRKLIKPIELTPVSTAPAEAEPVVDDMLLAEQQVQSPQADEVRPLVCQVIGSYPEVISARQLRLTLEERGIASRIVQIAKQLPAINWVYIPAPGNRKEALAVLKSLQEKKIDSFLMSEDGEYQYAISLGFFSSLESAQSVVRERRAQGYNAQLTKRVRERKAYWVALETVQSVRQVSDELLSRITDEQDGIKKQEISCAEVALLETIN